MKRYALVGMLIGLAACGPKPIACRAILREGHRTIQASRWHQGMRGCQALLIGLAVANNDHFPDRRRQVEFRNATEKEMIDLTIYYRQVFGSLSGEKQRGI